MTAPLDESHLTEEERDLLDKHGRVDIYEASRQIKAVPGLLAEVAHLRGVLDQQALDYRGILANVKEQRDRAEAEVRRLGGVTVNYQESVGYANARYINAEDREKALREALARLVEHVECPCGSLGECPMAKARALLSSPASEPPK